MIKLEVGDIVRCIKEPTRYASPLRVGEIYEVVEVSDTIYHPNQAIQLAGSCHGSWYIPDYFEKVK